MEQLLRAPLERLLEARPPPASEERPKLASRPEAEPLNAAEQRVADAVRAELDAEALALLPANTVTRFVRAFAWEGDWQAAVLENLGRHLRWREELDLDSVMRAPSPQMLSQYQLWRQLWRFDMYTTDALGHPVSVQRIGQMDFAKVLSSFPPADAMANIARDIDLQNRVLGPLSRRLGRRIYKTVTILDMAGVGREHLSSRFREYIKMVIEMPSLHYPETMWRMYIINTPRGFDMLWSLIRPFLHEGTRANIEILGRNDAKIVSRLGAGGIDVRKLPASLPGGSVDEDSGLFAALGERCVAGGFFWRDDEAASPPSSRPDSPEDPAAQSARDSQAGAAGSETVCRQQDVDVGAEVAARLLRRPQPRREPEAARPPLEAHRHIALLLDREWTYRALLQHARTQPG